MPEKMLELVDFHYHYGQIHAIKGISLHVDRGEIVSLIGGNGAGKTTTLRAISGLLSPKGASGEIRFLGKNIERHKSYQISQEGIAQCLEGRHVFAQLTVAENLMMGSFLQKDAKKNQAELAYVYDLFPRLKERAGQLAGTLSGGEQQMLAVGRALMQQPKLLMMDEPSLGLAPRIIADIFKTIQKINQDGMTILLVEQNSNAALQIAHRGYVMETGNLVIEGTADELRNNPEIQKSYLGRE
jgi:branched-chain amino acid transport system ATP-binding protein